MARKRIQQGNAYHDITLPMAESTEFYNELLEYRRMVEEDDNMDLHYKKFLLDVLPFEERTESHKKRRSKDEDSDVSENDNDSQYELFLKNLKEYEKCYVLKYENVDIKYEENYSSSDEEGDQEPRRKLRSAMKQKVGPSFVDNQGKDDSTSNSTKEESKNLKCTKSKRRVNFEIEEDVKQPTNRMVTDPEYIPYLSNFKVVDGYFAYTRGAHTVVYEHNDGKKNEEEQDDDDWSSDVEILDSSLFNKKVHKDSLGDLMAKIEYRKQVINVLKKPYDGKEYKKLWEDINIRKQEERHRELRHGREGPCSVNKDGKSYLDHHPDLGELYLKSKDDKPKRLNLLRGFFFWLQSLTQHGAFKPWLDACCLDTRPGSC